MSNLLIPVILLLWLVPTFFYYSQISYSLCLFGCVRIFSDYCSRIGVFWCCHIALAFVDYILILAFSHLVVPNINRSASPCQM